MLYHKLQMIRGQLRRREVKVSDALLIVSRCLRDKLPEERLRWLNRELLGYRADDLAILCDKPKFPQLGLLLVPLSNKKHDLEVPQYRFLSGSWGRMDLTGRLVRVNAVHLVEKSIFCNIGIQQIEVQLDETEDPINSLFSMSLDERTGAEFYCWSRELVRVYEAVRGKLGEFIDNVLEELKSTSNER